MRNQQYATLLSYHRINGSVNGNPNYNVTLRYGNGDSDTVRSSSDSAWCYAIDHSWVGKTVVYTLTRSGRINYMKLLTIQDTFVDPMLTMREV